MQCKWLEGKCLNDYNLNARKWKEHTSTIDFAKAFADRLKQYETDNETRAARIEDFFIEEAIKAGVVKVSKVRRYKNPNRLEKQLAPWFTDKCFAARN
jgi:hypothetical protein